jgi:TonB-dependent SusC/RagA subfamily outer membrane receptor
MTDHKIIKSALLTFTAIVILNETGLCQSDDFEAQVTTNLRTYFATYVPEKAYLQFDKPYYAAGDTIYYKAYVTEGEKHHLSQISGVLHVDLIDPENKIDQSERLMLVKGISWGDFALPDSLPAGNYRVRAYTEWMRNRGELDFFDRTIPVGSQVKSPAPEQQQNLNNKDDIQFFPEGGDLVTGIRSKIAFKAIDTTGLGIGVTGVILDNMNNKIDSFASTHLGMGYFYLIPLEGKTYKAQLIFDDGTRSVVDLPKQDSSGVTLSVTNNTTPTNDTTSKISITVETNGYFIHSNLDKDFLVLIYSGGKTFTFDFQLEALVNIFDLQNRLLQAGVNRVTLFSPDGEPLCERLLFIKGNDNLQLHIDSAKAVYTKREKVNLVLNATDKPDSTDTGHFSVSVIDENKVPEKEDNERTIFTDMLLTSELKGYVEQPNYYFDDTSEEARNDLDVLMLTQGYRDFEWKQVMDTNYVPLAFQPERGLDIGGRVTNLSGKPIENASVTLIPYNGDTTLTRTSDQQGLFHFSHVAFIDTIHIILSAVNAKGKNSTRITYINTRKVPPLVERPQVDLTASGNSTHMKVYLENDEKVKEDFIKYDTAKYIRLKEVQVTSKSSKDNYRTESLAGAGHADQVMHADEIEKVAGQLGTSLNGRLRGVVIYNGIPYLTLSLNSGNGTLPQPMLLILDGAEIPLGSGTVNQPASGPPIASHSDFSLNDLDASQIETVEVLKYASAGIYGMEGANGVLVITTKHGGEEEDNSTPNGILSVAPVGFYKARKFYSPKYDHKNINSPRPDLRSTIYWNPELETDKNGNASFDYYNADGTGTYKVTIEGIDNNGNIGRVVYRYQVE